MIGGFGPQNVLDDHQMLVAQGLGGLDVVPYTSRVGSNLRLRKNDAQLHAAALLKSMLGPGELAAPASGPQRPVSRLWPKASIVGPRPEDAAKRVCGFEQISSSILSLVAIGPHPRNS